MKTQEVLINPVLTYIANALDKDTTCVIRNACVNFYDMEELTEAKRMLWEEGDNEIIGLHHGRRDSVKGSRGEKLVEDIIAALHKLDAANKSPRFAVDVLGLNRMPQVSIVSPPKNDMSERLDSIEKSIASLASLTDHIGSLPSIIERISILEKSSCESQPVSFELISDRIASLERTCLAMQPAPFTHPWGPPPPDGFWEENKGGVTDQQAPSGCSFSPSRANTAPNSALPPTKAMGDQHKSADDDEDDYITVGPGRSVQRRRRQKAKIGTKKDECSFQGGPEPSRRVHIGRILKDGTEEQIIDHVKKQLGEEPRSVELISKMNSTFKSFCVEVAVSQFKKCLAADFWPERVQVRPFYGKLKKGNDDSANTEEKLSDVHDG